MSGTVAGFVDLLRNFDTQQTSDDNLIDRLRASGRKLVFYGDDTWLKLYPRRFERQEGTTSFFVSDTVEVDVNVTRNVALELQRVDWDVMVLHYLGLDHIGHSQGAQSNLMPAKQREMDGVVAMLVRALAASDRLAAQRNARARRDAPLPSLLVLLSDHGMTDAGGHGGTSHAESSTVALFVAASAAALADEGVAPAHWPRRHARLTPPVVAQVDLAPTLALLFGVPVPRSSIGVALADLLLASPLRGVTPSLAARGSLAAPFDGELTPLRLHELLRAYQINAEQILNGVCVINFFLKKRFSILMTLILLVLRQAQFIDAATRKPLSQSIAKLMHELDDARAKFVQISIIFDVLVSFLNQAFFCSTVIDVGL